MTKPIFSNKLWETHSTMYGNQQQDFQQMSSQFIDQGVKLLREKLSAQISPKEAFFSLLQVYQANRKEIAIKHSTQNAGFFGLSRDNQENFCGSSSQTILAAQYSEYNEIFLRQLADKIYRMANNNLENIHQRKKMEAFEKAFGMTFKFSIEFRNTEDLQNMYQSVRSSKFLMQHTFKPLNFQQLFTDYRQLERLKKIEPDTYRHLHLNMVIHTITEKFMVPMKKRLMQEKSNEIDLDQGCYLIQATLRVVIDEKLYALSNYFTWMHIGSKNPLETMRKYSTAVILHQDSFLNRPTLEKIAEVFAEAIAWKKNRDDLQILKQNVALLRFLYAHCMPSHRGDGAIGDWLELTLYHFHDFKAFYDQNKMSNMEPVSSLSFKRYWDNYDQIITIE